MNLLDEKELEEKLVASVPNNDHEILVTNLRHYEALTNANTDITRAKESLISGFSGDIIAEDLRMCLSHLGEILGQITSDEVLQNIFAHFCIGK